MEKAYFIFKMTGAAMVQPASSDFWKAPFDSFFVMNFRILILFFQRLEF